MGNVLEVTTMNRQQRRRHQKVVEWVNSLSVDKQEIIDRLVRERADEIAKSEVSQATARMLEQVETCICAAIVKKLSDDITFEDILDLLKDFDEFLIENGKFISKQGVNWKMRLNEIEPKIVDRMEALLKDKVTKKDIVKRMRKEFPELANSHIFNAYKTAKENLDKNIKGKITTDEAVNYIFQEDAENLKAKSKEIVKEVSNNVEKEIEDMKVNGQIIPKELEIKGMDIKGALENKLNETATEMERTEKEIKILSERLGKICIDAENLEKAIELIKDIDI